MGIDCGSQDIRLEPAEKFRMLASSRHMKLVSPVFKAMLRVGNFSEGQALSREMAEIPLPEDDPTAMRILLDIIHHNTRNVPRLVSLKVMTNITVLVDKYEMAGFIHLHAELWVDELRKTVPQLFTDDLLPWISISWIFKLPIEFKAMTKNA